MSTMTRSIQTRLEIARRRASAAGDLIDLAGSDFRAAGLSMPEELYGEALALWRSEPRYLPSGAGGEAARTAVAEFLTADGLPTTPGQVILTAGSSISYQLLFAALGSDRYSDEIALPNPAYPLFEELCRSANLQPLWYRLAEDRRYEPDSATVGAALARRPRAFVVISPNNPTGAVHEDASLSQIVTSADQTRTAIVSDEVFSAFRRLGDLPRTALHTGEEGPIVATLNGLSKLCAAPEIKLGWIALHGDRESIASLGDTLDTLHDALLTVSGPAEAFARVFLADRAAAAREAIAVGISRRRELLYSRLAAVPGVTIEAAPGGVHTILGIAAEVASARFGTTDDETLARRILEESGVHIHPGYLYGIKPRSGTIDPRFVASCVQTTVSIEEGAERLTRVFG